MQTAAPSAAAINRVKEASMKSDVASNLRRNCWPGFVIGLLLALALAVPSYAQLTTARLTGTLSDAAGQPIAGAAIPAEQMGTGFLQSSTTGTSGEYLFPSLPVGNYRLTVTMTGFKSY